MNSGTSHAARLLRRIEALIAVLSRAALALAALACLATLGLVCYAVAARYFFNRPQPWSDEAVGWLMVLVVMFAVPEAQRRGEHIGVDAVVERMKGRARTALVVFGAATVLAAALLLLSEGIEMVRFTRMVGLISNQLPQLELWMIQAAVPVGAALLLLVAAAQLACWAAGLRPRGLEEGSKDGVE